jgi:hypothetical protein
MLSLSVSEYGSVVEIYDKINQAVGSKNAEYCWNSRALRGTLPARR